MKNVFKIAALCVASFTVCYGVVHWFENARASMVIIPEFHEGFALCGEKVDTFANRGGDMAIIPGRGFVAYINIDHENDPLVQNLKAAALVQCN